MIKDLVVQSFALKPPDYRRLNNLCGPLNQNIEFLAKNLNVEIKHRGEIFQIEGESTRVIRCINILNKLYEETAKSTLVDHHAIQKFLHQPEDLTEPSNNSEIKILGATHGIKAKTNSQRAYIQALQDYDINFAVGPAGTGKTFLAVAAAVHALQAEEVTRIILVRPAVEAGEKLGFLPGDLSQKIDPYLRPLYDSLYEMLGGAKVAKLIENHIIEIAPLAYMRGRTLNDSFVILDEAQNTTREQMKMFLTRIGFGSKAVITGDITQIDLPKNISSGLAHAIEVLKHIEAIKFTIFSSKDVIRHPLVQKIIHAYEEHDKS